MLFLDVNVCVAAMRPDASESAAQVREWVTSRLGGHEQIGLSELVLSAMVRISTNDRFFRQPSTPAQALEFADALIGAPAATVVRPGVRHWAIFRDLVRTHRLRANDVPDAYLASLAMETGATLATLDPGFARFEGLKRVNPLD